MKKGFAYSPAPLRKVKAVQFGILSPEEIVTERKEEEWGVWLTLSLVCPIRFSRSQCRRARSSLVLSATPTSPRPSRTVLFFSFFFAPFFSEYCPR